MHIASMFMFYKMKKHLLLPKRLGLYYATSFSVFFRLLSLESTLVTVSLVAIQFNQSLSYFKVMIYC